MERAGNAIYDLRNKHMVPLPPHRLDFTGRSLKIMSIKLFNKLPVEVKTISNIKLFKRSVSNLLMKYSIYSVQEFLNLDWQH